MQAVGVSLLAVLGGLAIYPAQDTSAKKQVPNKPTNPFSQLQQEAQEPLPQIFKSLKRNTNNYISNSIEEIKKLLRDADISTQEYAYASASQNLGIPDYF